MRRTRRWTGQFRKSRFQRPIGINNFGDGRCGESERFIVVLTSGNAERAKEPYFMYVDVKHKESRLMNSITDNANKPIPPKGKALAPKVSELRQKLAHKAKMEPKFKFYALYDKVSRFDVLHNAPYRHLKRRNQRSLHPPEGMSWYTFIYERLKVIQLCKAKH